MKYLFSLLLVLNVVFYLWETTRGQGPGLASVELKLPPSGERIVLIEELPMVPKKQPPPAPIAPPEAEPTLPQPEPLAEVPSPETPPKVIKLGCYWLGPYESEAEARKALTTLPVGLEKAEVIKRSTEVPDGYWVLYPKADSMEQARINRQMLMDKGVRDLWLFDKGELQGAISLGLFKSRERATQAVEEFRARNIAAEIQPRLIPSQVPWIELYWPGERSELDRLLGGQSDRLQPCR